MEYYIKLLRTKSCEELESRIDEELSKNPNFLKSSSTYSSPLNYPVGISDDWNGLSFLVTTKKENFTKDDILMYFQFSLRRPLSVVDQTFAISFCKNPFLIAEIFTNLIYRLNKVYGVSYVSFSCAEDEFTHRICTRLIKRNASSLNRDSILLRHVGFFRDRFCLQNGLAKNEHYYEIQGY